MSFRPTPKQALFLWKMIGSEAPEDREPSLSQARPRLDPKKERQPLIDSGFLTTERRGRSTHLVLTGSAWEWAGGNPDLTLMRSRSADGAIALEGVLRRILPRLRHEGIGIADVFDGPAALRLRGTPDVSQGDDPRVGPDEREPGSIEGRVAKRTRTLSRASRSGLVPLSELRNSIPDPWPEARAAVLALHEAGRLELIREDNNPVITPEMRDSAVQVGPVLRHLFRWRD